MCGTVHGLNPAFLSVKFALLHGVFGDFSWVVDFGFPWTWTSPWTFAAVASDLQRPCFLLQLNVLLLEAFNFFVSLSHPSTYPFSGQGHFFPFETHFHNHFMGLVHISCQRGRLFTLHSSFSETLCLYLV